MLDRFLWRTSSYSNDSGGHCVEVAEDTGDVCVRDTQHRHLGHITLTPTAWADFLRAVKRDEL